LRDSGALGASTLGASTMMRELAEWRQGHPSHGAVDFEAPCGTKTEDTWARRDGRNFCDNLQPREYMDDDKPDVRQINRILQDILRRLDQVERRLGLAAPGRQLANSSDDVSPAVLTVEAEKANSRASPDFESRIGVHWLNRAGIIALLVGVSLFLKFAFEGEWVGPAGRVLIGVIAGASVIAWSEWFRIRGYRIFSFSLKALGLGVLYLSLWAAFQVYDLMPWTTAFLAMITVTAATAALALWQSSEILAVFALIGGFATPVLLYTGQSRQMQLFSYMAVLNVATLVLAGYRAWRRLLLVGVVATSILYFCWYAVFYRSDEIGPTFLFATAFFIIFLSAPFAESIARPQASAHSKILIFATLLNASAYFLALYLILSRINRTMLALCAVALAAAYAILGGFLFPKIRPNAATMLQRVHLALSTVFISLGIAVYFGSVGISLGWFMQAAVLMALGFRKRSAFIRWQALALIAIATAKVFAYDVWSLQQEYRIVSFVLLGMLLLVVSFLYQRDWLKLRRDGEKL
jgi:uncharacterized membrane protein